jgi:hypothetical protein
VVERFHRNGDAGSRDSPNGPVLDYCRAVLQTRHRTVLTVAFYAAVAGVLAAILFQVLPVFLPDSVAGRIGHNSEGLLLALVLAGWIQFVRPRLAGTRREWTVTILVAVLLLALGIFLIVTDLPSRFRTLNEALLAGALLVPYVQVRRPVPGRIALWLAGGTLVLTVVFNQTTIVTDLAEMVAALILVPLALDLVDRGILDPWAKTSRPVRYGWYAFLVVAPVVFSLLEYHHAGFGGLLGETLRYLVRVTEIFICLLLIEPYFTIVHGRTGSDGADGADNTMSAAEAAR